MVLSEQQLQNVVVDSHKEKLISYLSYPHTFS